MNQSIRQNCLSITENQVLPVDFSTQNFGKLKVHATTVGFAPIENATVQVASSSAPGVALEEFTTDVSGLTQEIELPTPEIAKSLSPGSMEQPYSEFDIMVSSPDFRPVTVNNVQLLPDVTALQDVSLYTRQTKNERFVIPPHTLFGNYPPKIEEAEIKPTRETGEIVLAQVVIPELVIVHDGPPSDSYASNYYVNFIDYIKNVASSEIYATWPEATIQANVLAILSFTLNRVFTEWYRNQGYNFTITSSTAFDHKWIQGRNIYDKISLVVDQFFTSYLSRPNVKQPILTQYCDGYNVQCPNWMTQWGSKDLGEQGKSAIEILKHFYGDSIYINTAEQVSGVPLSWPGTDLTIGSTGESVRMIQEQLNKISETYTVIPKGAVDGKYGPKTQEAVKKFQSTFGLPQTGVVDFSTWYKISGTYVAVTRMAE